MIDIDKLRKDCHGWVDQVIGSSNSGVAHQVVDAVVDTAKHFTEGQQNHGPTMADWKRWRSSSASMNNVEIYQGDPRLMMYADLLAELDTREKRALMAEETAASLMGELEVLRDVRKAAEAYAREFDHLIHENYPEREEMKSALGAAAAYYLGLR